MSWKDMLITSYTKAADIAARLKLSDEETKSMEEMIEKYPMCINEYYFSLIDFSDPSDPIRKMSVPDPSEYNGDGQEDTSGEYENTVMQGMQHKYKQTALILSTNQCAMYCRHCFRKRMVGASTEEIAAHIPDMARYVKEHTEISNILISGGDSFMNTTETIEEYLRAFSEIDTLDFIRFGTRVPVVIPQRIYEDAALLDILKRYSEIKKIYIVTQFNHPKELTAEAKKAIDALTEAGVVLRNQTVLLKGVNDDPAVMGELLKGLTKWGILPYYIFQCRPARGVKNQFQVPINRGYEIVEAAKNLQNGQGKSVRYAMSHPSGKIEILGRVGEDTLFKYHQSKYPEDASRIFTERLSDDQCWLYNKKPGK